MPFQLILPVFILIFALPLFAQPVMPKAVGPKPVPPTRPVAPPQPGEIDWRGLGDGSKKKTPHDANVAAIIRNAPYRVEVATSDGKKLSLTNAFTLERRRIFDGPTVAAYGFSPDGAWLYVVTETGQLFAIEPDLATVEKLGTLQKTPEQVIVDLQGAGNTGQLDFQVLLAKGKPPEVGTCPTWTEPTRVRVRREAMAKGNAKLETLTGWPETKTAHSSAISPNTKYRAQIHDGSLTASARFGGGEFKLNRTVVPGNVLDLQWMRDSDGLVALLPRKPASGCKQRPGIRVWRDDDKPGAVGWQEWTAPEALELVRPDVHAGLDWAPDGMRLLGVMPQGVVVVEPAPRFRGNLSLIAPPQKLWPKFRPGQRALPASAPPAQRHAELLMEQGDLDATRKLLKGVNENDAKPLFARLRKLEEVRQRRAEELLLDSAELRSDKSQHSVVKPVTPPQPPTPTEAQPVTLPQNLTPTATPQPMPVPQP